MRESSRTSRLGLLLATAVLLLPGCSSADSPGSSRAASSAATPEIGGAGQCDGLPQQRMNTCLADQQIEVDALAQQLLDELKAVLDEGSYSELQVIQTAWRDTRDAHCRWEAGFAEGGSVQPTVLSTCHIRLTWDRIDALKHHLCGGGGTSTCEESRRYDRAAAIDPP